MLTPEFKVGEREKRNMGACKFTTQQSTIICKFVVVLGLPFLDYLLWLGLGFGGSADRL
jgi:hypothetical protein